MSGTAPRIWAVHDGKPGMASQVLGLAEAMGFPFVEKRLHVRAPWKHLTPGLWRWPFAALGSEGDVLEPPWPDIVIACGRNAAPPSRAAKRASGGTIFWVQIQDPRFAPEDIDLMVVPSHDPAVGRNVFRTLGAVHRVTAKRLTEDAERFAPMFASLPRPLVAVLLGGDNRVYRMTDERFAVFADRLAALNNRGYGLAITPSRRTDPRLVDLLRARLSEDVAFIWDQTGANPYFGLLGLADAIITTADSVSMVSEAAATAKPVHIVDLDGGSAKFERFHEAMRNAGITHSFRGAIEHWRYAPPDDTARAAAEIRRRFSLRLAEAA
jgi:uncharacterized protein